MRIKYYPYDATKKWGVAIAYPDVLPAGPMPWMFFSHGMGDLSTGTIEDLDNKLKGYDFDGPTGPLPRQFAPIHPDTVKQVDKRGWALIWVAYSSSFSAEMFGASLALVEKDFSLVQRCLDQGFSLGSGAGIKRIKDAIQSKRIACGVYVAPTNEGSGTWANAVNGGALMHLFGNGGDKTTPMSIVKAHVAGYNAANPPVKAYYTIKKALGSTIDEHGGNDWAYAEAVPVQVGGEGVTNLAENIYDWYADVLQNGPRPMRTGTIVPPVNPAPPTGTLTAAFNITDNQVITSNTFQLDASASTGVGGVSGYWWELNPIKPDYKDFLANKTAIEKNMIAAPRLINLASGTYTLRLTTMNGTNKATKLVTFSVALDGTPVPRTITSNDGKVLKFSDGTSETIVSVTTSKGTYTV